MINTPNETGSQLEINVLGRKVIYDEETDEPVKSGKITKGVWCFKYKNGRMYLMGQYQIHAVNILSNGTNKNYNLDYFKEKYNCDTVSITVIPDSPFAIEKIGMVNACLKQSTEEKFLFDDIIQQMRDIFAAVPDEEDD